MFCRDNSLEGPGDLESKQEKVRHGSASSSLDEASCSSAKGASGGVCLCSCPSSCCCGQNRGHYSPTPKNHSATAGKKCKSKLLTRANSSSSGKEEGKLAESQGDVDAQLLERRSTNSSELDSPSLSGSLPSVADSHCSHLSSELSCSDPETSKPTQLPCSTQMEPLAHNPTVTPLPEVEHDRLEQLPPQGSHAAYSHRLLSSSPPASPRERSSGMILHISEEGVDADTEPEKLVQEPVRTTAAQPVSPTRKRCIQTDI